MPLRPIVSNCGSPKENPSFLLERILTQLLQFVPAHLSSSDDLLEKFRSKYSTSLPPDSFLFTMDVSSLYTNILIKEVIPTICDMIQRHIEAIIMYGLTVKEIEHLLGPISPSKYIPQYIWDIFLSNYSSNSILFHHGIYYISREYIPRGILSRMNSRLCADWLAGGTIFILYSKSNTIVD